MKHVYLVRAGESQYKIGVASNIVNRVKALQTSNGNKIELVTSRLVDNPGEVEKQIHQSLKAVKLNGGREWFRLSPGQALNLAITLNEYQAADKTELQEIHNLIEQHAKPLNRIYRRLDNILAQSEPIHIKAAPELAPIKIAKPSDDDLIDKALFIFNAEGKASTSLLQRRLSIGYGKAARILDRMEKDGLISELDGSKPREVLA